MDIEQNWFYECTIISLNIIRTHLPGMLYYMFYVRYMIKVFDNSEAHVTNVATKREISTLWNIVESKASEYREDIFWIMDVV